MCTVALQSELKRYLDESETPQSIRAKTHTFPDDLYLAGDQELHDSFSALVESLCRRPKTINQKSHIASYNDTREQLFLNLARCLLTRKWLLISGSKSKGRYDQKNCHLKKSYSRTQTLLSQLKEERLIKEKTGAKFDKGHVENHYFPTKLLAKQLIGFAPFVEQRIKPPYLWINQPEEVWKDYRWTSSHDDVKDLTLINEFAKDQSWTLKAPIKQTFNKNPFTAGRLSTPFQNLPARNYRIRQNTLINGNPIAEVDFNANHLRIFLAFHGQPYIGDDPYMDIATEAGLSRDEVKGFMTVAMNCSSFQEAEGAALGKQVSNQSSKAIYQSFKRLYPKLNLLSGFGVYAMNFEGVILRNVMLEAIKQNIFTLPIHDAVACEAQHAETVNQIMNIEWCKEVAKFDGIDKVSTKTKITKS